jgi:DNA-binding response OmpR family regulator
MIGDEESNGLGERGSILVFDGEPVVLDLLTHVLTREGYRVTATPRSDEAFGLATSNSFDLAIADLGLRKRDGCYLVRRLRQARPDTPIVATTAYPAAEIVTFAEKHAEALLPKPFAIGELLTAVRTALQHRLACGQQTGASAAAADALPATT